MTDEVFDITIIGAGPTGLFAAFYAGLRGMRAKLIDALPELGGQLAALYPEKMIYDVAGFRIVQAKDLVSELVDQGLCFGPAVCLGERIETLRLGDGDEPHELHGGSGIHRTRTLLIAAGIGAFSPTKLKRPGVAEYENKGLHYFVRDLDGLASGRVLVVGGGDSAVDWALAAAERGAPVTLIHRRDGFRAHEETVKQLFASPVEVRCFWELAAVGGDGERVQWAEIECNRDQRRERLEVDTVILSLGFKADLGPLSGWGLEIVKGGIVVDAFMRTNLPRVFAAGDVAAHPAKLKLIATGFGEAATAVNFAKVAIDPSARAFPGHSSELERPPGG